MSWFISNLQEGIVTRTTLREVLQLRATPDLAKSPDSRH